DVRFTLVDAHHTHHRIFHPGDKRFANDRDRKLVVLVNVGSLKNLLFFTENRSSQRPEVLHLPRSSRNLKDKILGRKPLERVEDHVGARPSKCCAVSIRGTGGENSRTSGSVSLRRVPDL